MTIGFDDHWILINVKKSLFSVPELDFLEAIGIRPLQEKLEVVRGSPFLTHNGS